MQPYHKDGLSNVLCWEYSLDLKTTFENFQSIIVGSQMKISISILSDVPKHFPLRGGGASII